MNFTIIKNPIIRFITVFTVLSLFFYYGFIAYMGITSEGNIYSPFLDKYLNIIAWYRYFLLVGAHLFTELAGYHSFISNKYHLQIVGGHSVQIVFTCLGTGLLGVWFSFVIAYPSIIIKKIKWIIIGFLIISFLNEIGRAHV